MNTIVNTKKLAAMVAKLDFRTKDTSPIAQTIGIEADFGGLKLYRATHEGSGYAEGQPEDVKEEGQAAVSYNFVKSIRRGFDCETVELKTQDNRLVVIGEHKTASAPLIIDDVQSLWNTEHRLQKKMNTVEPVRVDANELFDILKFARSASDIHNHRPEEIYKAIAIIPWTDGVMVAGTDGRHFHFQTAPWAVHEQVLIPLNSVDAMMDGLKGVGSGTVELYLFPESVILRDSGLVLGLPILGGKWPAINAVTDEKTVKTSVTVNRDELLRACMGALAFRDRSLDTAGQETIRLSMALKWLRIETTNEANQFYTDIKTSATKDMMDLKVNAEFLLSGLDASKEEQVKIVEAKELSQLIIQEGERKAVIALIRLEPKPQDIPPNKGRKNESKRIPAAH